MNTQTDIEIIQERGEALINDLPNIMNLRERAKKLHSIAVDLFKKGKVTYSEVKYGFDEIGLKQLRELEREYLKKHIKIESDCNCGQLSRIGDTCMILPNGEHHLSWCNQAKEFDQKYVKLKERFP